ncbi:MAG: hypothetical protein RBU30_09130 [Polyangia bacterium]|nr:hypothetical protein [Polyangia bacterium]
MAGAARQQEYFCTVVGEAVRVTIRTRQRGGFNGRSHKFAQCNQELCQYVEENALPCPLRPEMFDAEEKPPETPEVEPGFGSADSSNRYGTW